MAEIDRLKDIMAQLRDPETGCPWDIEQNFLSIAPHTIEEAYEVVDAIEKNDMQSLKEELGDLLLQVIFYAQMANEQGLFNFEDVAKSINDKLVVRHPHVFGDKDIKTARQQEASWEDIKQQERANKGEHSALDGVALALPALTRAVKLQKRAAKVGFDWPDVTQVLDKIEEEIDELKVEIKSEGNIEEEYGDILFALANLGRKMKISPEEALKKCNSKFEKRFNYIEKSLKKINKTPEKSTLKEMESLWNEAKKL